MAFANENQNLKTQNENLLKENLVLKKEVEKLTGFLVTLKREKFGRKSEKVIDDGFSQASLFESPGAILVLNEAEALEEKSEEITIKAHKRKKTDKKDSRNLPIDQTVVVDVPTEEKLCKEHRAPLQKVGEREIIKIEYISASKQVIKYIYPIYGACSEFCAQENVTQTPQDMLPNALATPSLLADLIISKYEMGLPFYRIEKKWAEDGFNITRATQAKWLIDIFPQFSGLINLMNEDLVKDGYIQCDETPVHVLKLDGKKLNKKSYAWVRYNPIADIVLYEFYPSRSGKIVKNYLEDFKGYFQSDAYNGYNAVDKALDAVRVGCWYHARQGFFKAYEDYKSEKSKEILLLIKRLFKIESNAQELNLDYKQRKELRDKESIPIIDEIKIWLDKLSLETLPSSPLGKAIQYALSNWKRLIVFLQDGRIELSNNWIENKIRPFSIGRKNWIFFDTDKGAEVGCFFYSLIETAKCHGLNRRAYLKNLFEKLPLAKTQADLEALLPYPSKK